MGQVPHDSEAECAAVQPTHPPLCLHLAQHAGLRMQQRVADLQQQQHWQLQRQLVAPSVELPDSGPQAALAALLRPPNYNRRRHYLQHHCHL